MTTLEEYRHKPGAKLKTEFGTPIMVLNLCTGMIGDGGPSGGEETVAVVNLETGRTNFDHGSLNVVETPST